VLLTMKELCSFICLLLVLPGYLCECTFRDENLFDGTFDIKESTTGNDYGIFQARPMYIWEDHRVHFTYHESMSQRDKKEVDKLLAPVIKSYMNETCISFHRYDTSRGIPEHHLKINAKFDNPSCGGSGGAVGRGDKTNQMRMDLYFPRRTVEGCSERSMRQVIYHEMGHAMGIGHTQRRSDRKHYVIYRKECVNANLTSQFDTIDDSPLTKKLAYECNSIMHYWPNTFNKDGCGGNNCSCNVLTPKPGSSCKAIDPSDEPTKLDWKLINMGQNCPGF